MLLKLEKGVTFGDAVDDNVFTKNVAKSPKSPSAKIDQNAVKNDPKKVLVLATNPMVQIYKKHWSSHIVEVKHSEDAINKACEASAVHDLTVCHLKAKSNLANIKEWTSKLKTNTPQNGLFVTVWTGSITQNAFVGLSFNSNNR